MTLAYNGWSYALASMGDHHAAIAKYHTAIGLDAKNPLYREKLAVSLARARKNVKAVAQRAIAEKLRHREAALHGSRF
jgi:hypothetical protein